MSRHNIEQHFQARIDDSESLPVRTKKSIFFFKVRWESLSKAYQPQNQAQLLSLEVVRPELGPIRQPTHADLVIQAPENCRLPNPEKTKK